MNFGLNLKLARIKAGMLQNEVAAKVGITQAQYSVRARQQNRPSLWRLNSQMLWEWASKN